MCVVVVVSAAHRSMALLPLFNASSGYLRDKISSTVLTSLSVGVPMVVPPAFLSVYTEIKKEHVLVLVRDGPGGGTGVGRRLEGFTLQGVKSLQVSAIWFTLSFIDSPDVVPPLHSRQSQPSNPKPCQLGRQLRQSIPAGLVSMSVLGRPCQTPEVSGIACAEVSHHSLTVTSYVTLLLWLQDDPSTSDGDGAALMSMLEGLAAPGAAELLRSKRRAIDRLRYVLNQQATAKLDGLIAAAKGKPRAGAKQQ